MTFLKKLNRRLIYDEPVRNDHATLGKIEVYKRNEIKDEGLIINEWAGWLLLIAFISLIIVLTGALLLINWRRPGLYGEECNARSCAFNLKCISSICQCPSMTHHYFNSKECLLKKSFNLPCSSTNECESQFVCFNGKCACNQSDYWFNMKCLAKKTHGQYCMNQNECLSSLKLTCDSLTRKCTCNSTNRFWSGQVCFKKRVHEERCLQNSACSNTYECLNGGFCLCNENVTYYDGHQCLLKKSYLESCTSNNECNHLRGLSCSFTSQRCLCSNSTYLYFDSQMDKCVERRNESASCSQSDNCYGDMTCYMSGVCNCVNTSTHYFDYSTLICTQKTLNNTDCASTRTCRSDLGLSCVSNKCQCDTSTRFWFISQCSPYRLYGESCSITSQCNINQLTVCLSSVCTCNSTHWYFDSLKCVPKKVENEQCSSVNECLGNMNCTIGACKCPTTHFWDGSLCQMKYPLNTACTFNEQCIDKVGLSCRNLKCSCLMSHYWNTTLSTCTVLPPCFLNGGSIYYCYQRLSLTWDAGRAWCQQYDGDLISVTNTIEENIIINMYNTYRAIYWVGARSNTGLDFRWNFNSQSVPSSYWSISEPNGGASSQPCGFAGWNSFKFNDFPCNNGYNFLCERR